MSDFTAAPIDEMEAIYSGGFKRARAALGVTSMGISVSDLPPGFEHVPPHVHSFDGQEELYLALTGDGWLEIGEERIPLDDETTVRVGPGAVRRPIAGPNGLRLLSVGATRGATYEPFPNSQAGAPEIPVPELTGVKAATTATSDGDYKALRFEQMDNFKNAFFRVRHSLGIEAFGVSMIQFTPNSEHYPRHDESASGQEEIYVPLRGGARFEIGDESIELVPGAMVRVAPSAQRQVLPGDDGLRLLVLGGTPGAPFAPQDR